MVPFILAMNISKLESYLVVHKCCTVKIADLQVYSASMFGARHVCVTKYESGITLEIYSSSNAFNI